MKKMKCSHGLVNEWLGGEGIALMIWAGQIFLGKKMNNEQDLIIWRSERRALQVERIASAKVLRKEGKLLIILASLFKLAFKSNLIELLHTIFSFQPKHSSYCSPNMPLYSCPMVLSILSFPMESPTLSYLGLLKVNKTEFRSHPFNEIIADYPQ